MCSAQRLATPSRGWQVQGRAVFMTLWPGPWLLGLQCWQEVPKEQQLPTQLSPSQPWPHTAHFSSSTGALRLLRVEGERWHGDRKLPYLLAPHTGHRKPTLTTLASDGNRRETGAGPRGSPTAGSLWLPHPGPPDPFTLPALGSDRGRPNSPSSGDFQGTPPVRHQRQSFWDSAGGSMGPAWPWNLVDQPCCTPGTVSHLRART